MRKPFEAKKLSEIFAEQRDAFFQHELSRFVHHKKWQLQQPLTGAETTFYLVNHLGSAIVGEGWNSVFDQAFTYSELQHLIDLFRRDIPLPSLADRLEAARAIYYLGRTDLNQPDSLWVNKSVVDHLTDAQWDEMMAHGEGVADEGGDLLRLGPLFSKWCHDHRNEFVEPSASSELTRHYSGEG